jgi:hypothetical protein
MPIDIIPSSNPYQLKIKNTESKNLLLKVPFFPNTLIKTWHRVKNKTEKKKSKTDVRGKLFFLLTQLVNG